MPAMTAAVDVTDQGQVLAFRLEDLMRYHGPGSPAGVALALKAMELAFPLVGRSAVLERREIAVTTPFRGPGARDAFELVTRAVTEGRYVLDATLERPERGWVLEQFVFRVEYRGAAVTVALREGYVDEEFVTLARAARTATDEARFTAIKAAAAARMLGSPATDVVEVLEIDFGAFA
jgi:hypothetical protein